MNILDFFRTEIVYATNTEEVYAQVEAYRNLDILLDDERGHTMFIDPKHAYPFVKFNHLLATLN